MFIPIRNKIRAAILIIVLLFTLFTLFYLPLQEGKYLLKTYNSQVQNLANSVAMGVKIALNEDNYEGVQTAMEYVKDKPDFLFVSILQTDTVWDDRHTGYTIEQSVFKTFPDNIKPSARIESTDSSIVKYASFNTPLMNGAVALAFSTNEITQSKKSIRLTSLLVSACILSVGLIIGVWLSRSISKPVMALSKAAKKVGKGDLTPVVQSHSNDEIGMLTQVFNTMVSDLAKAHNELNNTNATLSETNKTLSATLNDLKATQAQLIQSEKMASLGELTAGIAHEIQNPLNFINNFADVNNELIDELRHQKSGLKNISHDDEEETLKDIYKNNEKIVFHGKRADAIVKSMLQHSRKNTGQREVTDINALCDEYIRLSYHGLRAKQKGFNAEMQTDFDAGISKINIVQQDIGRVLLNLFNNAFYAVTERKKVADALKKEYRPLVSVTTKTVDGTGVEIIVKDNGFGIPANIVDKIFQPFFTTKPAGEGTGLGLSLAYDIITKEHNGKLLIETKENEGTKFIIRLKAG